MPQLRGDRQRHKPTRTQKPLQQKMESGTRVQMQTMLLQNCLLGMMPQAQQEFERPEDGRSTASAEIPESLFDENGPLDRETAQQVRETLERWTGRK